MASSATERLRPRLRPPCGPSGVLLASLALVVWLSAGALVPWNRQAAFVAVGIALGLAALSAPTTYWVVAALVATFTFQGLPTVGLPPSLGTVLPIAISWGALGAALLNRATAPIPRLARPYLRWLGAVALGPIPSGLFNHVEVLRPFVSIGLLGVPYVVLAAMLIAPPSSQQRSLLIRIA